MNARQAAVFAVGAAAMLLLAGCGALLGGGKPAQLYRFGAMPASGNSDGAGVVAATSRTVMLMPIGFAAEIEGDRVLTVRASETLYIKGVRWAAPGPALFGQAVVERFRTQAPWIAISERGDGRLASHALRIDIDRFEADYQDGDEMPPTIRVVGRATLHDLTIKKSLGSFRLAAAQRAAANNAVSIVAAFDRATETAVDGTVAWIGQRLPND